MTKGGRLALLTALVLLSGCASFAKGVTEAILEQDKEDTRACHIDGPASQGLEAFLRAQEQERRAGAGSRRLKVLMVHGIGEHQPGYSGRLTENLMRALGLNVREEGFKEIDLREPEVSGDRVGQLRISRFTNKARTRDLIFYELTWSAITEDEKSIIAFDDSTEYTFRRAALNAMFKGFINSHIPDSLIFLGKPRIRILSSVRQAFCWMTQGDWDAYLDAADEPCNLAAGQRAQQLLEDDYVFVTHSLGSRVVIDTLQYFGNLAATGSTPGVVAVGQALPQANLRIYMFANQLPLLEMGQERAPVRGQIQSYCRPQGRHYRDRILSDLPIYAFSDPNDILSYPVPPKFAADYLDSRLCPNITNITLNLAPTVSLLGLGELANPAEAHGGYDHDERVIALVARGIGSADTAEVIKQRCTWLETTKSGW